jgi:proteasome lid subunit RPN8/RPN11
MVLTLNLSHLTQIQAHAERTYPQECCGLLIGTIVEQSKTIAQLWETENAWTEATAVQFNRDREIESSATFDRDRRYTIAPEDWLRAQKSARDRQLDIVGIYHSHPNSPAVPSEYDRVLAWPQYSYVIVSVHQGRAADLLSWQLDDCHQFQSEEILTRS